MDESYVLRLSQNINEINEKILSAAIASGRTRADITLCAADKTRTVDEVAESAKLGIDVFGENHVQELIEKYDANAYLGKPAHMIGHLQTNKVKAAVLRSSLIQSVDSVRLILAIQNEAEKLQKIQDILLEINIGYEESKTGADISDLEALCESASALKNIRIRGLMTIPPMTDTENTRRYFEKMRLIFEKTSKCFDKSFDTLSMGMTRDYESAILEGSTMVRIGTGIYGARFYPK